MMIALKSIKGISKNIFIKSLSKFCVSTNDSLTSNQLKTQETPVHLRPYDKNKYEVPSSKLKVSYTLIYKNNSLCFKFRWDQGTLY